MTHVPKPLLTGSRTLLRAPDTVLPDHQQTTHTLMQLMGTRGLLLAFTRDLWLPASARRIQWLQSHVRLLARMGVRVALIVASQPHTLHNFHTSSPMPPEFPLLADADHTAHDAFDVQQSAALLLLDAHRLIRARWNADGEQPFPQTDDVIRAIETL
jgi:peroxiredoxin